MRHNPGNTAMSRGGKPSSPMRMLHGMGVFDTSVHVLDYGCGKGDDVEFLNENTFNVAVGYDPHHRPITLNGGRYDVITCTYVLNVLTPRERKAVVQDIRKRLKKNGRAFISVRRSGPGGDKINGEPYWDGVMTSKGTFQRLFTAKQILRAIPGSTLVHDKGRFVTVEVRP